MRTLQKWVLEVYDHLVIYGCVILLGGIFLFWGVLALIGLPLFPARQARLLGRYIAMLSFRFYLACLSATRRFSFDMSALEALRGAPPLVLAPNHPCMLDALMVIAHLPNVACVLKSSLMNNFFTGGGARFARFIRNEPAQRMVQLAVEDMTQGSHLLLFPEGTRTVKDPVNPFTGSVGLIAARAQTPVQTILIETDSRYLAKGWGLFHKPPMPLHYRVRLGKRFDPPRDVHRFMSELEHYFSHELVRGSAFHPARSLSAH